MTLRRDIVLCAGFVALVSGCFLVRPDDEVPIASVRVRLQVDTSTGQARAGSCDPASTLLLDPATLGRLQVWGGSMLLAEEPLVSGGSEYSGELSFELGAPGTSYEIRAELLARGDELDGSYCGTIALSSGLTDVQVDAFTVDLGAVGSCPAEISVSSDAVQDGSFDSCVGTVVGTGGVLSGSYAKQGVDIDGRPRDIEVELFLELQPLTIYRATAALGDELLSGGTVELDLVLEETGVVPGMGCPTCDGCPDPERLVGSIALRTADADPVQLSESGRIDLIRVGSVCLTP